MSITDYPVSSAVSFVEVSNFIPSGPMVKHPMKNEVWISFSSFGSRDRHPRSPSSVGYKSEYLAHICAKFAKNGMHVGSGFGPTSIHNYYGIISVFQSTYGDTVNVYLHPLTFNALRVQNAVSIRHIHINSFFFRNIFHMYTSYKKYSLNKSAKTVLLLSTTFKF